MPEDFILGRVVAQNIIDKSTGEILAAGNEEITESLFAKLAEAGVAEIQTLYTNELDRGAFISQTLRSDDTTIPSGRTWVAIYRMMRPGEPHG